MSQFQQSQTPDVAPRLSPDQIESLLIHLIRLESLLNEALEVADANLFDQPGEHVYDAVWRALTHYKREQRCMPTQPVLFAQACAGIQGGSVFGGSFNPINTRMAADPQVFRSQVEQFTRLAFFYDSKPLLEGLQAWSNTQIGKVFKPPVPQGSGNGFTERIRDKWNALGRTPAVNPQRSGVDAFMQAVEQQKSGQFGPR